MNISGFDKVSVTSIEQIGNFKDKKASEFNLNVDNFNTYAKFRGYIVENKNEVYIVTGTRISSVEKISYDDAEGSATFKAIIIGGSIN
ncbi:MAG: hypothetical protein ACRC8C_00015 [Mycoplasmoidaceae bacterium]